MASRARTIDTRHKNRSAVIWRSEKQLPASAVALLTGVMYPIISLILILEDVMKISVHFAILTIYIPILTRSDLLIVPYFR
jgi:hypothetical protein